MKRGYSSLCFVKDSTENTLAVAGHLWAQNCLLKLNLFCDGREHSIYLRTWQTAGLVQARWMSGKTQ